MLLTNERTLGKISNENYLLLPFWREDEEHVEEQREPVRTETADRFSFKHKTNER